MITKEEFEFLNTKGCDKSIDDTKAWIKDSGKINYIKLSSSFVKIRRRDRRNRNLPRGTKACIVSAVSVHKIKKQD